MISHGKDIKIFTGNANPKLAADICKIIGTKLGESEVKSFADGEASVSLYETVRGSDGESLGSVEDIIIDPQSGEARQLVLSSGGFLGIGAKQIAVDLASANLSSQDDALVLPNMTLATAVERAEEWRVAFANDWTVIGNHAVAVTVSIGVAVFPCHGGSARALIEAVDQALYAAKRGGRNRVVAATAR